MDTAPMNAVSTSSLPQCETAPGEGGWDVFPLLNGTARPLNVARAASVAAKRAIDVSGALLGLVMLGPGLLAISLLIRADSPGPVLFRQRRLGRYGRPFWIYKFRTMRADAERLLTDLEAKNEAARGVLFKMRDDPRVTRLGSVLRQTNLDELPQLFNVLKGEMSLVGPRPLQMRDSDRLRSMDARGFARRLEFPPGLTGAWQVGRSSPVDSEHLLDLDLDYVENWSLVRDLHLLYRTIFVLLKGFRSGKS